MIPPEMEWKLARESCPALDESRAKSVIQKNGPSTDSDGRAISQASNFAGCLNETGSRNSSRGVDRACRRRGND